MWTEDDGDVIIVFLFHILCRPAGWDNLKKISILYENMHSCKPEDYYTDIILAPPSRKVSERKQNAIFAFEFE